MKVAIILALVAVAAAMSVDNTAMDQFTGFKAQFGKTYATAAEEAKRFSVFSDNLAFIADHNAKAANGEYSFTVGVNEFADLTSTEFAAIYTSSFNRTTPLNVERLPEKRALVGAPKASVDWRAKGAVTPIKNQGQCGSCWSFSTTGSVEGAAQIASGKLVSLSEQQLMDCSTAEGNMGCNGGLMDYAFEYIIKNGGLDTEADYSYTAQDGTCNKQKEATKAASITGYKDVPHNEDAQLEAAVDIGPVSVAIEADKSAFQLYKSGVFDDAACGTQLDHGVLVVGYGTSTSDYWIVKNSWGATWGDQGYIMIARKDGAGICGINMQPSYPTGATTNAVLSGVGAPVNGHYEDPKPNGCGSDEEDIQITGVSGDFCSPSCSTSSPCPTDVPAGVTAQPECVLEKAGSSQPTNCALICDPSKEDAQCGTNASCKKISTVGVCTYDD